MREPVDPQSTQLQMAHIIEKMATAIGGCGFPAAIPIMELVSVKMVTLLPMVSVLHMILSVFALLCGLAWRGKIKQ